MKISGTQYFLQKLINVITVPDIRFIHCPALLSVSPIHLALVRSQNWGLQKIILAKRSQTQKPASENVKHMPFRRNPEGPVTITHLANATGKGFILCVTVQTV